MAETTGGLSGGAIVVGLIGALLGSLAAIATGYLTYASKDQELRVHLVEIAIGILRADPKDDIVPARGWAINIIEQKSGVVFSDEDRKALLHKPILDKGRRAVSGELDGRFWVEPGQLR